MQSNKRKFNNLIDLIGDTPLVKLENFTDKLGINLYAKLEGFNPMGSMKDRVAKYVIEKYLREKKIKKGDTLIESTSGNFGLALAMVARHYGLKLICVVDPHILKPTLKYLICLGVKIITVNQKDKNGGYLLSRYKRVGEEVKKHKYFWINQHDNYNCPDAHFYGLAPELYRQLNKIDYIFLPVSTTGTAMGIGKFIKENNLLTRLIAVDVKGSIIFGCFPGCRTIPGMGASRKPKIFDPKLIHDFIILDEKEVMSHYKGCIDDVGLALGGSSIVTISAISKFVKKNKKINWAKKNIVAICPDLGTKYLYKFPSFKIINKKSNN